MSELKWIKCSERLPVPGTLCLVIEPASSLLYAIARFNSPSGWIDSIGEYIDVTHWIQLHPPGWMP